jgi:hypothetical protein
MPDRKTPIPTRGPLAFYAGVLKFLNKTKLPFMVGGTYAVNAYVGLDRKTKDIDVFCRAGDSMRVLNLAREAGYKVQIEDERWIAKIGKGTYYCDIIWGSANAVASVGDAWFQEAAEARVLDVPVRLLPPTELIWAKAFIADRYKYDGNDVAHVILVKHQAIDWRRLMNHFEQHWEVLLIHVLKFRYIYPSEREDIPRWVLDELLSRLAAQMKMPTSRKKSCRGRLFSRDDFLIDITQWGFADLVGDDKHSDAAHPPPMPGK